MSRSVQEIPGPVTPARFAHVVFRTARYDEMVSWYRTVLNARVVFQNDRLTFLTYDDEHHRVAVANVPELSDPPKGTTGVDHVAYTFATMGELLHTYVRLRDQGVKPVWCVNHGPTTSLYYRDPDGTRVELQIDNFPDAEALHAWFRSGAFAENPIGVSFDPEKLLARYENGDAVEELVRQGSA